MSALSDNMMPWVSDGVLLMYPVATLIALMIAIGYGLRRLMRKSFKNRNSR